MDTIPADYVPHHLIAIALHVAAGQLMSSDTAAILVAMVGQDLDREYPLLNVPDALVAEYVAGTLAEMAGGRQA